LHVLVDQVELINQTTFW